MPIVQSPQQFRVDFCSRVRAAEKRVWIQAMVILSGKVMCEVEAALLPLPARGVDVRVQYDWITYRHYHEKIVFRPVCVRPMHPGLYGLCLDTADMFRRMQAAGIRVTMLNPPSLFHQILPIAGRNHIKLFLVDDTVWITGMNLYDGAFEAVDFALRFDSPAIAEILAAEYQRTPGDRRKSDTSIPLTAHSTLHIDAGYRPVSVIYDTAVAMARGARRRILYISQMVPEHRLLHAMLQRAQDGVIVDVVTSYRKDALFTAFPMNIPYLLFRFRTRKAPNIRLHHLHHRVHGKLLAVDSRAALFGSHNLVETGVKLHTAEIAVETRETDLIRRFEESAHRLIRGDAFFVNSDT